MARSAKDDPESATTTELVAFQSSPNELVTTAQDATLQKGVTDSLVLAELVPDVERVSLADCSNAFVIAVT